MTALTTYAMTTVATTESTSVRPMALACSSQSPPSRHQLRETVLGGDRGGQVAIDVLGDEETGQEGTEGAAHGVNAEGIEGVVVAELGFDEGD